MANKPAHESDNNNVNIYLGLSRYGNLHCGHRKTCEKHEFLKKFISSLFHLEATEGEVAEQVEHQR